MPLFLVVTAAFELKHRIKDSKGVLSFETPKTNKVEMTMTEFDEWIKAGKQLVTIDNLVIDLGSFA